MSTFVDFEALKARVKIEQTIPLLGLKLRQHGDQYRGLCPACKQGGDRALAINSGKQSYYCFSQRKGGDLIALVAHVRGMIQKDAAAYLDQQFGNSAQSHSDTVHSSRNSSPTPQAPRERELKPLDYLVFTEAVEGLGLTEATCTAWGAGTPRRASCAAGSRSPSTTGEGPSWPTLVSPLRKRHRRGFTSPTVSIRIR
jgi:hypothetical protein